MFHAQGTAWPWDQGKQSKWPAVEGLLRYDTRLPNLFSHRVDLLPALDRASDDTPNLPDREGSCPHLPIT